MEGYRLDSQPELWRFLNCDNNSIWSCGKDVMSFKEKLLGIIPDHTSFQRHKDLASKSEDGSFISEVEEERSDSSYFKDSQGSDNSDEEQD